MSDEMLFGVLSMPYKMAMSSEISRLQFYNRVQEALGRINMLETRIEDLQGIKFSDRNYFAMKTRAENAEAALAKAAEVSFDMAAHLQRQAKWSEATFGPGSRAAGVIDHIRKELKEIEADPTDLKEWIDVVILALDGAWRSGALPHEIIDALVAKQTKNENRDWPDWRTADPNKAIEHVRTTKSPSPSPMSKRDWPEDYAFENGFYQCTCSRCKNYFMGHKGRTMCKFCDNTLKESDMPTKPTILDQPAPIANDKPAVWNLVMQDMKERDQVGRDRYGTPLQPFNGRDALVDAYQEALDMAVYIRQAIYERDGK